MCDNHFSLNNLSSSSYANENFITDECISNWVKFIIFSFWIAAWSCTWLWFIFVFIQEVRVKGCDFNLKKRVFLLSILAASSAVVANILMLLDIQNSIRYLFYAIYPWVLAFVVCRILLAVFNSAIQIAFKENYNEVKSRFQFYITFMDFLSATIVIVSFIIGPMVSYSYGEYSLVNVFYIVRISSVAFLVILFCALIRNATNTLTNVCSLAKEDNPMINSHTRNTVITLVRRLNVFNNFCLYIVFPMQVILLFSLPVWQIWDLYGVFWFQYIINELVYYVAINIIVWVLKENTRGIGLSGSSNERSQLSSTGKHHTTTTSTTAITTVTGRNHEVTNVTYAIPTTVVSDSTVISQSNDNMVILGETSFNIEELTKVV